VSLVASHFAHQHQVISPGLQQLMMQHEMMALSSISQLGKQELDPVMKAQHLDWPVTSSVDQALGLQQTWRL
jgi:hypothetical protein